MWRYKVRMVKDGTIKGVLENVPNLKKSQILRKYNRKILKS